MHVMIIGAAGMIGRKLATALAEDGLPNGRAVTQMTLVDVVPPPAPAAPGFSPALVSLDLSDPGAADMLAQGRPDIIVHLAAVVSGEAE